MQPLRTSNLYALLFLSNFWQSCLSQSTTATDSWQQYIRGPNSTTVYPVQVLSNYTTGNVTNPEGLLQGSSTVLTRPEPATPPSWPAGTVANASSYTDPNVGDGQERTYYPSNAIDGNVTTFWNDATIAEYPDVLTITTPSLLNLSGITVLSNTDGVPVDFTVEVLQDSVWSLAATITGNSDTQILVPFTEDAINVSGVQITVTQDQALSQGEYTRINEVYPGLVSDPGVPTIVLDFGIDVVGFLQISFRGASDNSPGIRLAFSETLTYLTDLSDFTRSDNGDTITPGSDQIAVSADPYVWVDTYGCAYGDQVCADGLHGFRYVKIYLDALASDSPYTQAYGEVIIDSVSLNYTAFLGTPDTFTGWFECSDAELTQLWYDAAYTNDMIIDTVGVNTSDPRDSASPDLIGKLVLLDGAKRDRDPYSGDIAVSGRSLYLTHNVSEAVYNVIGDLADNQRSDGWIPPASINNYGLTLFDYPLYWVLCSYDLLLYTGNTAYIQQYYTTLQNLLNNYYPSVTDATTSLLNKDLAGSGYGDYAFLNRTGIVTYYNTLYVLALQNAANIATFLGNDSDATTWSERAETVSAAINDNLWDATTGAYLDSLSGPSRHAQDGNSMAVLAGISSSSQATSLLSYFDSLALPYGNPFYDNDSIGSGFSERVYAFISYFEIQARFVSGNATSALDQIRRMYGWMATNDPTVTFWEAIGTGGSMYEGAYTSAAHGWSTGVLPALSNFVLGAMPTGPGFTTWSVKPIPGDVTWAMGVLDTPNGPLNVSWTMEQTAQFSVLVGIPSGTSGNVSVPVTSSSSSVTLDGTIVWNGEAVDGSNATFADNYVTVPVSGVSANVTVV